MSNLRRWVPVGLSATVLGLLFAHPLHAQVGDAQAGDEPIHLEVDIDPACGTESGFLDRVRQILMFGSCPPAPHGNSSGSRLRTATSRAVVASSSTTRKRARRAATSRVPAVRRSSLRLRSSPPWQSTRPSERIRRREPATVPLSSSSSSPGPALSPPPASSATAAAPAPPQGTAPLAVSTEAAPTRSNPAPPAKAWNLALGADVDVAGGILAAPGHRRPGVRRSGLDDEKRLGAHRAGGLRVRGHRAHRRQRSHRDLRVDSRHPRRLPTRWAHGPFELEPCARAEAGILEGEGGNIVPHRQSTPAWFALDGTGRARWFPWRSLFVDLEGGIRFPLTRPTFLFEPDTIIYRPPAVAGFGGIGLGMRFL